MFTDIKFPYQTSYKGRNGHGICSGISIYEHKNQNLLEISPVNTKGYSFACYIKIFLKNP